MTAPAIGPCAADGRDAPPSDHWAPVRRSVLDAYERQAAAAESTSILCRPTCVAATKKAFATACATVYHVCAIDRATPVGCTTAATRALAMVCYVVQLTTE